MMGRSEVRWEAGTPEEAAHPAPAAGLRDTGTRGPSSGLHLLGCSGAKDPKARTLAYQMWPQTKGQWAATQSSPVCPQESAEETRGPKQCVGGRAKWLPSRLASSA